MQVNDEFAMQPVTVWRLWRNGQPIVDTDGAPVNYESPDAAIDVATKWEDHRAPTWAELQSMSDDDLRGRAARR